MGSIILIKAHPAFHLAIGARYRVDGMFLGKIDILSFLSYLILSYQIIALLSNKNCVKKQSALSQEEEGRKSHNWLKAEKHSSTASNQPT
jgi:hypothetical protein